MSVAKNALNLYAIQGANILIPLLALPFLGRALGVSGFGTLAISQLILQYVILITDFGFNLTATRRISSAGNDPDKISQIISETSLVRAAFAVIGTAFALTCSYAIPALHEAQELVLISTVAVIGSLLTPAWLFHGTEKNNILALITIAPRIVLLIPTALLVKSPDDLRLAAYLQFLPQLFTGLLSLTWIFTKSPFSIRRPTVEGTVFALKDGFHIFASTILTSVYAYANGIILQFMAGSSSVGIYAAAEKLIKAVSSMINPAIQAIYPRVCRGESKDLRKLYVAIGILTIFCWLGALALGPVAASLIFGDKFREAGEILKIFAIAPIFSGAAAITVQLKIIAWGEHRHLKKIYALSVLIHSIQAPIMIFYFGAYGAALSIVVTEMITLLSAAALIRRIKLHKQDL